MTELKLIEWSQHQQISGGRFPHVGVFSAFHLQLFFNSKRNSEETCRQHSLLWIDDYDSAAHDGSLLREFDLHDSILQDVT